MTELISFQTHSFVNDAGMAMNMGIVTFLNPPAANFEWGTPVAEHRFNPDFIDQFSKIISFAESDPMMTGLIVTGEGKYFSNGVDIGYVISHPAESFKLQKQIEILMGRILTLNMLTVCFLNGHTTAAGALLSLSFDYRYMGERGFFFLPAVDLGIVYSHGMIELVKSKVPDPRIHRDLMIISKRYITSELLNLGIVDSKSDDLIEGISFLKSHAKKNKASLKEIKSRIYASVYAELCDTRISDMHWHNLLEDRKSLAKL